MQQKRQTKQRIIRQKQVKQQERKDKLNKTRSKTEIKAKGKHTQ